MKQITQINRRAAVARSENSTSGCCIFVSEMVLRAAGPPVFLYQIISGGTVSCSGVERGRLRGSHASAGGCRRRSARFSAEPRRLPARGQRGRKLISRPFPPRKKRARLSARQTVRPANVQRVVKVSLNGVENQPVLAGLHVDEVVERQPVFVLRKRPV